MAQDETEVALRKLSGLVIEMHKRGTDKDAIAETITMLGITPGEAENLVGEIIESYSRGIDLSEKPGLLESNPAVRDLMYLLGGISLTLIGSIILSVLLGVISGICREIGLGVFGEVLVKLGEKAAGAFMGLVGMGACSETKSMAMFIGCIIGVILYYLWLWVRIT